MSHAVQNQFIFLGIDLKKIASLWYESLTEVLSRPAFSWLGIQESVTVLFLNKTVACYLAYQPCKTKVKSSYQAIMLPNDGVLFHKVKLPLLDDDDMYSALALQMTALSPFPIDDLAWGYQRISTGKEGVLVQIAITSRHFVAQQIERLADKINRQSVEVWTSLQNDVVVIRGYGEHNRFRNQERNLAQFFLAMVLGFGILIGLAAIPTIIKHHQLAQATVFQSQLGLQIQSAMENRDRLVSLQALLETLNRQRIESVNPLDVLYRITASVPDDSWLERLEMQGQSLQLAGRSKNATALIQTLSSAQGLGGIKSIAPITRDSASGTDRFVIEANIIKRVPMP